MKLPEEAEAQLKNLAELLAESRINAVASANDLFLGEVFRILITKGIISLDEFSNRLSHIETLAAATRLKAPDTSEAVTRTTMSLRNAFFPDKKSSN